VTLAVQAPASAADRRDRQPGFPWIQGQDRLTCGELALLGLMTIEGIKIPDRMSPLPDTYGELSMLELEELARSSRLKLVSVHLRSTGSIDRPMILFVRREGHGHYLLARPVGRSGRKVQLIDSDGGSRIVDRGDLGRSPDWTGHALVVDSRTNLAFIWLAVGLACLAGTAGWIFIGRFRRDPAVSEWGDPGQMHER